MSMETIRGMPRELTLNASPRHLTIDRERLTDSDVRRWVQADAIQTILSRYGRPPESHPRARWTFQSCTTVVTSSTPTARHLHAARARLWHDQRTLDSMCVGQCVDPDDVHTNQYACQRLCRRSIGWVDSYRFLPFPLREPTVSRLRFCLPFLKRASHPDIVRAWCTGDQQQSHAADEHMCDVHQGGDVELEVRGLWGKLPTGNTYTHTHTQSSMESE